MVEYGLQVKDLSGNVILKITDRLTRFVGSLSTGISNGSFTIPNPGNGNVFFAVIPSGENGISAFPPAVSRSGNTISWSFQPNIPSAQRVSSRVTYGVY